MTIGIPLCAKPAKDCLLDIISPNEENDSNLKHFLLVACKIFNFTLILFGFNLIFFI